MESLLFIKQKLIEIYSNQKKSEANIYLLITVNIAFISLLILTFINKTFLMNEFSAFIILGCATSFIIFGSIAYLFIRLQSLKKISSISEQIENKTRVYQDSLNTVANFIDQKKSSLTNIESALAKNTSSLVLYNLSKDTLISKTYNKWRTILIGSLLITLFLIQKNNTLIFKGINGYHDWANNSNTYFKIEPGDYKTRKGSSLKIIVQLTREELVGAPVFATILKSNAQSEKLLMRHLGKNSYEVNIYDIQENFQYFVYNFNSTSNTFKISIFEIPEIKEKEIMIEPPHYTGLPVQKFNEFEYVAVPENSRIQISVGLNKPANVFFNQKAKKTIFEDNKNQKYSYLFRAKEYTEYSLLMIDKEAHEFETNPQWVIETIPDLPPSAEIKEPANDKKVFGIEELEIKYTLTDDYGIHKAQLIFQTPTEGLITIPLEIKASNNEKSFVIEDTRMIPLLNLNLQNGDMISYYIKLWDNKEPIPQVNVSAVKFLSVVPGKMKKKDEPPKDGQGKDFRIDDLIAEQKRIYRSTIPLQFEKNANIVLEQSVVVANALGDLKTATALRLGKLAELAQGNVPPEINELFEMAGYHMGEAEKSMRTKGLESSIQSQTTALQKLYQLSKILEKDSQQSDKPSEETSDSKSDKKPDDKKKDDKNKSAELKKKIQEMLDKLEEIKEKNSGINNQANKTGDILSEDEKKYFGDKKTQIKSQMQATSEEMQSNHEFFPVADNLNSAIRESTNEEYNFSKGQKQNALKHAVKTDFFLTQAIQQLKAMKKEMDNSAMQQSQKTASDMIKKQNDIKEKTQKESDPSKLADLSKAQENLKEDLKNLENQIKDAIQKTEAGSPQASNELEKALNKLNKENLDQKMGKASKSIFYGLKDKSKQEQNNILKGLEEVKDQIQSAQEKMSDADKQQLLNALAQLNQIKENSKESSEKQKAEDLKNAIDEIGGASVPQFLKDTAKLAEQIKDSKSGKQSGITADQLLMEAMSLIEKKLKSMEMTDQVRKKMNLQMPPDVYKKMVEEYFQNLSKKAQ